MNIKWFVFKKETKNLFESFYPKYVYFLLRKDNLFNNRLIKIRGIQKVLTTIFLQLDNQIVFFVFEENGGSYEKFFA